MIFSPALTKSQDAQGWLFQAEQAIAKGQPLWASHYVRCAWRAWAGYKEQAAEALCLTP